MLRAVHGRGHGVRARPSSDRSPPPPSSDRSSTCVFGSFTHLPRILHPPEQLSSDKKSEAPGGENPCCARRSGLDAAKHRSDQRSQKSHIAGIGTDGTRVSHWRNVHRYMHHSAMDPVLQYIVVRRSLLESQTNFCPWAPGRGVWRGRSRIPRLARGSVAASCGSATDAAIETREAPTPSMRTRRSAKRSNAARRRAQREASSAAAGDEKWRATMIPSRTASEACLRSSRLESRILARNAPRAARNVERKPARRGGATRDNGAAAAGAPNGAVENKRAAGRPDSMPSDRGERR